MILNIDPMILPLGNPIKCHEEEVSEEKSERN